MNQFITKEYLNKKLKPLIKQNRSALRSLRIAVYQHGYYVKHRGKTIRTHNNFKAQLKGIQDRINRIIQVAGFFHIKAQSFRGRNRLVKLNANEYARLMGLLRNGHRHCIRVPKGRCIPYLSESHLRRLGQFLKKRHAR